MRTTQSPCLFSDCLRYHGYALDVLRHPFTGVVVNAVLTPMPRELPARYARVFVAFPAYAAVDLAHAWLREYRP